MKNFVISAVVLSLISSASWAIPPHPHRAKVVEKGLEHKVEKIEDKVDEAKNNSKPKTTTTEMDAPVYPMNTLAVLNLIASFVIIHGGPSN